MSSLYLPNFILPRIKSIISAEYIKPTEWIDEIEKSGYKHSEIIELIEVYEFIIASLIKAISYIHEFDQPLNDEIMKIISRYTKVYINNDDPQFKQFSNIIYFNKFFTRNYEYGLYENNIEEIINSFIVSWNNYYIFIFGETANVLKFDNLAANKNNVLRGKNDLNELVKFFNVQNLNYNEIKNLLDFFSKKKNIYKGIRNKLSRQKSFQKFLFNNLLLNIEKSVNDTIERTAEHTQGIIKEEGKLTREKIKESMDITNEILKIMKYLPDQFKDECAEKLWMLARHREFIAPLQALICKGFVENNPNYYTWKGTNKNGVFGKNVLACFIYYNVKLEKYVVKSKLDDNNPDDGIFSKYVWEPFNLGFNMEGLENSARNTARPKNYDKFLKIINENSKSGIIFI